MNIIKLLHIKTDGRYGGILGGNPHTKVLVGIPK